MKIEKFKPSKLINQIILRFKRILLLIDNTVLSRINLSSIRNTRLTVLFGFAIILILVIITNNITNESTNSNIRQLFNSDSEIFIDEQLTYGPSGSVQWESEILPGTEIGDNLIRTNYYFIEYSNFLDKYVVTIKAGKQSDILAIENWLFQEELPKYKEFENGENFAKVKIIDDRDDNYHLNNPIDPFGGSKDSPR